MKFILIALLFATSCSTLVKTPDMKVSQAEAIKSWKQVLSEFVDEDGWVDFEGLQKQPTDLNKYIAFVAEANPENDRNLFPTAESKLAHYINSYNALSIYNILDSNIPETNAGLRKIKFFVFKKIRIGGKVMSLKDYEDNIIRKQGDPRIHFALNCMAVSCPKLLKVPYDKSNLNQQLNDGARYFFAESRNLTINLEKKMAYTSEILKFFPEDFLAKASTLIEFINTYATAKIPADFNLDYFDYNWTVINKKNKPNSILP